MSAPLDGLEIRDAQAQRVEVGAVESREAACSERAGERARLSVHTEADLAQPLRPMIHGVHGAHVGEQRLRCADVARGVLAPDVLLARLQRQAQRAAACAVPE